MPHTQLYRTLDTIETWLIRFAVAGLIAAVVFQAMSTGR